MDLVGWEDELFSASPTNFLQLTPRPTGIMSPQDLYSVFDTNHKDSPRRELILVRQGNVNQAQQIK